MKRIAIAVRQLSRNTGAARVVHFQIRQFRSLGYGVDAFGEALDAARVRESGGEPHRVRTWPFRGLRRRRAFSRRVGKRVRRRDYELVVGHGDLLEQDVLFLHNCVHAAHERIRGVPLPDDDPMAVFHGTLLRDRGFRFLVANSRQTAAEVIDRFALSEDAVEVVYPGYDPGQFHRDRRGEIRARSRADLGLDESTPLVGLITSGDFEKRGLRLLVEALAALPAPVREGVRFLVVGSERRFAPYARRITEAGLGKRFLGHFEPVPDVERFYHALDVAVLPSRWEEFGCVVLEAMACGLPVVVTDTVGAAEILEGPARDLVVPGGSAPALSRALQRLLRDADARAEIGAVNVRTAREHTAERQADRTTRILRERGLLPVSADST